MPDNTYTVEKIDVDVFDVFVSDDGGYTWEYYASYDNEAVAREEGEAAVMVANKRGESYA